MNVDTEYWILDASQTDPPSDLPNRQFGGKSITAHFNPHVCPKQ